MEDKGLTREEMIQNAILELLGKDPNGMELNDLGNALLLNTGINPMLEKEELGPCLSTLNEDGLVREVNRIDADGSKLVFRCERFVSTRFGPINCLIFGHDVPEDMAFEIRRALYKGGFCRSCGKLIPGEFIGNVWTEEFQLQGYQEFRGYDVSAATKRGLKVMTGLR